VILAHDAAAALGPDAGAGLRVGVQ
jgi:hypothetical protein